MHSSVTGSLGVARARALLRIPASCFPYTPRILAQHTLWRVLKLSHARTLTTERHDTSQGPTPQEHLNLRRHRSHRKVRTLDPVKLTPNDYVDFRAKSWPRVNFVTQSNTLDSTSNLLLPKGSLQLSAVALQDAKFPPNATGFLYYHRPPFCPPLAGEIRFRVTSSSDPAGFASGSDLLTALGLPWKIPLLYMAVSKLYTTMRALLLQDGLVTPQLLETASAAAKTLRSPDLPRHHDQVGVYKSSIIGSLRQAFAFRFGMYNGTLLVVGDDTALKKRLNGIGVIRVPADGTSGAARYNAYYPFLGTRFRPVFLIHQNDAYSFVFRFGHLLL